MRARACACACACACVCVCVRVRVRGCLRVHVVTFASVSVNAGGTTLQHDKQSYAARWQENCFWNRFAAENAHRIFALRAEKNIRLL